MIIVKSNSDPFSLLQMYKFEKAHVPIGESEKAAFLEKLLKFGVSIKQYESAYALEDITMCVVQVDLKLFSIIIISFGAKQ